MLELKAKYIKRTRKHGCNFIKKGEHKYILIKSIPPYTKLFSFLIIGSKNYIFYPKIAAKSAATVVFGRDVLVLENISIQFSIQPFLLPCDTVVVLFHQLLSFILWCCHIKFVDTLMINCHYSQ